MTQEGASRPVSVVPGHAVASDPSFAALTSRGIGPVRRWLRAHPRLTDVAVAALYAVPTLMGLTSPTTLPGLHWPLAAVTTAALLLRRRWPLPALAVVLINGVISSAAVGSSDGHELAAMLLVYTVASTRPPLVAWPTAVVSIGVITGGVVMWGVAEIPEPNAPQVDARFVVSTVLAVMLLVAHAIGLSVRARRQHAVALVERANQLALERDQREQLATAAERARIAREMHDVVAHSLSVMIALADGGSASLTKRPERTAAALDQLSETGRGALADMRRILGVLREEEPPEAPRTGERDGVAPPEPTHGDLEDLLARFREAGLTVRSVRTGASLPTDPALRLTVYRIVQEALTNVLRYAPTSAVEVDVERTAELLRVRVDNTRPAITTPSRVGSGRGLIGMRERVATYGGRVEAAATPDGGWRVLAEIDIEEERP